MPYPKLTHYPSWGFETRSALHVHRRSRVLIPPRGLKQAMRKVENVIERLLITPHGDLKLHITQRE